MTILADNQGLSTLSELLYLWRILVVSMGAFTVGFALFIGWAYSRGNLRSGIYRRGRHVAAIMASYCILATELIVEIGHRAIYAEPVTWRLPVATVAFGLGIWALYQLVKARAIQHRH